MIRPTHICRRCGVFYDPPAIGHRRYDCYPPGSVTITAATSPAAIEGWLLEAMIAGCQNTAQMQAYGRSVGAKMTYTTLWRRLTILSASGWIQWSHDGAHGPGHIQVSKRLRDAMGISDDPTAKKGAIRQPERFISSVGCLTNEGDAEAATPHGVRTHVARPGLQAQGVPQLSPVPPVPAGHRNGPTGDRSGSGHDRIDPTDSDLRRVTGRPVPR